MQNVDQEIEDREAPVMEADEEDGNHGGEDRGIEDELQDEEVEGLDLYDDVDLGYGMTPPVPEPIHGNVRSQPAMETEAIEDEQQGNVGEADDEPDEEEDELDLYEDADLGYMISPPVPVPVASTVEPMAKASNGRPTSEEAVGRVEHFSETHKGASRTSGQEASQSPRTPTTRHAGAESAAAGVTNGGSGAQLVVSGTTAGGLVVDSKTVANEYMARHGLGGTATNTAVVPMTGENAMLVVAELHWWTTDAEVETALAEYGRVKTVRFFDEKASGKSKGYCQVEFYELAAALKCKENMNGRVFNNRACVVAFANPSAVKHMTSMQQVGQVKQQAKEGSMGAVMSGRVGRGVMPMPSQDVQGPARAMVRGPVAGRSGPIMGGPLAPRGPVGIPARVRGPGRGPGMVGPYGEGMPMGAMAPRMMGPGFEGGYDPSFDPSYEGYGPMGPGYAMLGAMGMQGGRGFGPRAGGPPFAMGPGMGPAFGSLPPLPVAPHVNPAFFGRGMSNGAMGNGAMGNGGIGMEGPNGWEGAGWEDREYAGAFEGDEAERGRAMMRERRRQERVREDWEGGVEKERRPPSREVGRERRASDLDEELEDYGKRRRLATERNAER